MKYGKMMFAMFAAAAIVGVSTLSGCATARTKWTDKTMRVMIDPDGIPANHYVKIQQALVESGKWVVVDRGEAFNAIKKEQEREHRDEMDRYLDREKFAHWGKMYGVGGVVVAHVQCTMKNGLFKRAYPYCHEYLAIVDTNTGVVMASAEEEAEGGSNEWEIAPSWEDVVAKLNSAYPTHFESDRTEKPLNDYKDLSKEEAQRQREIAGKKE